MKVASFRNRSGRVVVGAVSGDGRHVTDLSAVAALHGKDASNFVSMLALIEAGDRALDDARRLLQLDAGDAKQELSSVTLLAPLPRPPQIRDFMTFPKHITQSAVGAKKLAARLAGQPAGEVPEGAIPEIFVDIPVYYIQNRFSVIGPDQEIRWPQYSRYADFELELAAVIGKRALNVGKAEAGNHIFGFTIFNDFSARDQQMKEMGGNLGPTKGKSFDGGNALGPWIVTRDELINPYGQETEARVNGEVWSRGTTSGMLHSFEDIIAYVSRDETLHPGEVLGSGTVGSGCGLELDRYLGDGDLVELTISGIGTLANRVRIPHLLA